MLGVELCAEYPLSSTRHARWGSRRSVPYYSHELCEPEVDVQTPLVDPLAVKRPCPVQWRNIFHSTNRFVSFSVKAVLNSLRVCGVDRETFIRTVAAREEVSSTNGAASLYGMYPLHSEKNYTCRPSRVCGDSIIQSSAIRSFVR
jgi:hypothetical protein